MYRSLQPYELGGAARSVMTVMPNASSVLFTLCARPTPFQEQYRRAWVGLKCECALGRLHRLLANRHGWGRRLQVDDDRLWMYHRTAAHPPLPCYRCLTAVVVVFFRKGVIVVIRIIGIFVPAVVASICMQVPCQFGCFGIPNIHDGFRGVK